MERRDEILKLRHAGLTYQQIGERFGISRERVRQILRVKLQRERPSLKSKIMLTVGDVSQLLGIHANTVRRWCQAGAFRGYRLGSRGDRRFRRQDIEAFLTARREIYH